MNTTTTKGMCNSSKHYAAAKKEVLSESEKEAKAVAKVPAMYAELKLLREKSHTLLKGSDEEMKNSVYIYSIVSILSALIVKCKRYIPIKDVRKYIPEVHTDTACITWITMKDKCYDTICPTDRLDPGMEYKGFFEMSFINDYDNEHIPAPGTSFEDIMEQWVKELDQTK